MASQRYFLVATAAWFLAFGMQSVVFAWLVTIVLREPAEMVGWAQTAFLLPGMLLILLAGALADRVGPDRQALWAQGFAALIPWLLIAAVHLQMLNFSAMVLYAVLMGCAQAFVTPARDGLLNHVAGRDVQRMVLLASLFQFSFQILGYFIAGFADAAGPALMLALQSVSSLVGVVAFFLLRRNAAIPHNAHADTSMLRGVLAGARTVMASATMRVVVVQNVAMACFFMGCFVVCFPLVIREVFAGSAQDLGVLNAFNSLGLVVTILLMLRVGYVSRPGRALLLFQGLGAVVLLASGFMGNFILFVISIFCWGLCGGIAMPMSRTVMQELAPAAQRGRVMSFYAFSFMGAGPLGALLGGYLSELFGPQMAIKICASLMLLVVLVISLFSKLWQAEFTAMQPSTERVVAADD